jgi:hypothetical protein
MITEPPRDGQRTPLQDFQTPYIGGAEPAVVRRAFVFVAGPNSRLCAIAKEVNDHDGSYRLGSIQWNKHEVER